MCSQRNLWNGALILEFAGSVGSCAWLAGVSNCRLFRRK
jgi:hypothetical protein